MFSLGLRCNSSRLCVVKSETVLDISKGNQLQVSQRLQSSQISRVAASLLPFVKVHTIFLFESNEIDASDVSGTKNHHKSSDASSRAINLLARQFLRKMYRNFAYIKSVENCFFN
jgi:hypothetical protein